MSSLNSRTARDILITLKKVVGAKTDLELAQMLDFTSTGTISGWVRKEKINWNIILDKYENISIDYLKTGSGSPFINHSHDSQEDTDLNKKKLESLSEMKERLDRLSNVMKEYEEIKNDKVSDVMMKKALQTFIREIKELSDSL